MHAGRQARRHAGNQGGRLVCTQAGRHAARRACRLVRRQAGRRVCSLACRQGWHAIREAGAQKHALLRMHPLSCVRASKCMQHRCDAMEDMDADPWPLFEPSGGQLSHPVTRVVVEHQHEEWARRTHTIHAMLIPEGAA
eukprot:357436-Chlamydomonas_euryale.AAC.4